MTQTSFPWASTITGDASVAPYDHLEFSRFFGKLIASDAAGFVVPQYANNLTVQASSPAAASVDVATGAAYIKGFFYENDALTTLAIAANASGNPRIDRIILRIDFAAQTVRLVVLQGTAAATPALPALTQIYGTTWEISLAYVWVANGFATIGNAEIHDERLFTQTAGGLAVSDLSGGNLIFNSEFMGYGDLISAPPTTAPEGWTVFGTIPTIVSATKPTAQPRGRALQMTAGGANRGIAQTFNVPASRMVALKFIMNVTAGDVGEIVVTTNSGAPQTITRTMRRTGSFIEETIYYLTESDATTMTIREYCVNNTDVVQIGQSLAAVGFWPGLFREIHEIIFFDVKGYTDASWSLTAKSTGNTTITLSASFGGLTLPGTRAVLLSMTARDSGSAAAGDSTNYLYAAPVNYAFGFNYLGILLAGETNDRTRQISGFIELNASLQFLLSVAATGALTLDANVFVIGVQT